MNLFSADLNTLTIADLEDFLAINGPEEQRPSEGVKIDYKLKEPSGFPDTVAAFANTAGGLLFIGVDSKKRKHNVPVALPGETFVGGDVRARITGKIISQVTPRPDISVGIASVSGKPSTAVVVVRVAEGSWPPYEFSERDKTRIPVRIEDTSRQATLREIEQLFNKRQSFRQTAEERLGVFDDQTKPKVPAYLGAPGEQPIPTHAYQTWIVRPRMHLHLRLDRAFDISIRSAMQTHFKDTNLGQFHPPGVTGDSHLLKWQAGISDPRDFLTYVRHVEVTSDGSIRYSEKIDRHANRRESVSDLLVASLEFWKFASDFYQSHNYFGSLSVLQRIDCQSTVQLFANFPNSKCSYYFTDAIGFAGQQHEGATGMSRMLREMDSFDAEEREELILEFMLSHLRNLCQASVDYGKLKEELKKLPDRLCAPYFE